MALKDVFGICADGRAVEAVTLENSKGMKARIINFGATLQSLYVPDKNGQLIDIVLGHDDLESYVKHRQFLGATVGRFANRIALGRFSLDGRDHQLAINNLENHLHGGLIGYDQCLWKIESFGSEDQTEYVTLSYISPDGEENYPGNLSLYLTYRLNENNDLTLSYKAVTDQPTIINLTHHSLFNLSGVPARSTALDALLQIEADTYLPTTASAIPTGEIKSVKGTPFDFTSPQRVDDVVRQARDEQIVIGSGIDHNFILREGLTDHPKLAVTMTNSHTGIGMEILTTEPGVQVYTGNFLNAKIPGKGNQVTRMGDGIAFECQHFPDSPNQPSFPTTRLNPGEVYSQTTIHHFFVTK